MRRRAVGLVAALGLVCAGPAVAHGEGDLTVRDLPLPLTARAAADFDPDGLQPIDDPVTCLARTLYWEARGEGAEGMRAVAHVVANRVAADGFPGRFCAVIKDGGERAPCQFSWWCDGREDAAREWKIYRDAREIARQVINGDSIDPTGGATLFHHRGVNPGWASRARRTAEIGEHVFYRLD